MATPTYRSDKLVNKILSIRSNRRAFLKATTAVGLSVSALGGIGAFYGCSGVQKPRVKNPLQKEIEDLMWGPSNPARVDRLINIMEEGIKSQNQDITRAAAEGLVPHTGKRVVEALTNAYSAFQDEQAFQRYIIQLLAENYAVNNAESRVDIIKFFRYPIYGGKTAQLVQRNIFSALIFINNQSYRILRQHLRRVRLANNGGIEMQREFFMGFILWPITASVKELFFIPVEEGPLYIFKDRFPGPGGKGINFEALKLEFNLRRFGIVDPKWLQGPSPGKSDKQIRADQERYGDYDEKVTAWRKQLDDKDPNAKIDALLNLDEKPLTANPADLALLLKMLDDSSESPEVKRVILSILGSNQRLAPDIQQQLVKYLLDDSDDDLVLSAARGLRFRACLPAGEILDFLARKETKDGKLGKLLEDLLLSSLDSPDTFNALVWSIVMTDPKDREDKKRRVDELRIWYLRLGDKRDDIVRQATSYLPEKIRDRVQNHLVEWLRNISMIQIWTDMPMTMFLLYPASGDGFAFSDSDREPALVADTRELQQIAKELGVYDKNMGIVDKE